MRQYILIILLAPLFLINDLSAADKPANSNRQRFENEKIAIRLIPRSPEQIAAFYEARKFPKAMIAELKQACFITVSIQNKSSDILWLDLQDWRFVAGDHELKRYHRNEWKQLWTSMAIPMASQSTFRWTLLPEMLDFRPAEREGGNIILERTTQAFTILATFHTGENKTGQAISVNLDNIHCAGNQQ